MKKTEIFKVEGGSIKRERRHCPKCGPGVFLAQHNNRFSCGKCGYTEFKGKKPSTDNNESASKDLENKKE